MINETPFSYLSDIYYVQGIYNTIFDLLNLVLLRGSLWTPYNWGLLVVVTSFP